MEQDKTEGYKKKGQAGSRQGHFPLSLGVATETGYAGTCPVPVPLAMPRYSLELDLTDRRVLVVGLGQVGRRKVEGLIAAGANILAVDPTPSAEIPDAIKLLIEPYRADHLSEVALAFATATSDVNRRVVADAQERGIWVNSASNPDKGDFFVPASWHDGPISLAVSTSGASPALAAALRDRAAIAIGPGAAVLAGVLIELRAEVLQEIRDPLKRRRILSSWDAPEWLKLAETETAESLRKALRACMTVLM